MSVYRVVPGLRDFDWFSADFLTLRRSALAGRLEGCRLGSATRVAKLQDARAWLALATTRDGRAEVAVQRYLGLVQARTGKGLDDREKHDHRGDRENKEPAQLGFQGHSILRRFADRWCIIANSS